MEFYFETKFDDHADHEESCVNCGNVESQCTCEEGRDEEEEEQGED